MGLASQKKKRKEKERKRRDKDGQKGNSKLETDVRLGFLRRSLTSRFKTFCGVTRALFSELLVYHSHRLAVPGPTSPQNAQTAT